MNYHTIATPEDESIWAQIISLEGQSFRTARGLEYTYRIKRNKDGFLLGEILFERKEKSVTRATLLLAYQNAVAVQQTEGCVSGPKKLGVFGASYLYPIFLHLGICSRRPEMNNNHYHNKEEKTMPRPKGSKNKKKRIAVEGMSVEELIAQRTEAKAALEAERDEVAAVAAEQKARLKALKSDIRKLDKELAQLEAQKAAAEAATAAEAAKAALQVKIDELLAQGKTLDDIMNMLG